MGFFVIADAHTFLAFALAGLPGGVPASPEEARELLARGRDDSRVGVVLITERLAQQIQGEVDAARSEGTSPFILEIPDLKGPVPETRSLLERLRSMMGIPQ